MRRFLLSISQYYKATVRLLLAVQGLTPTAHAERRVASGQTWEEFCDTLKAAGANIIGHSNVVDMRTQAEGYRYLSRLVRAGLEAFVEYADPRAPVLRRMVHETVKMGADNPDNHYLNAVISGEYEYRVVGTRGTVNFLTLSTQKGGYGQGGDMPPTGFLDSKDLIVAPDGTLEIAVSCEKQEGNWLPMAKDSGLLIVRQTFLDRDKETPAQLSIHRVGGDGLPEPLDAEVIDRNLMNAANLVAGASFLFSGWVKAFQRHTNRLPRFDPDKSTRAGGDPEIAYYHSYWRLNQDQAMLIEVTPPTCEHWNFQLNNHWMESLDYRYYTVHINAHTAQYEQDGSVRIVVAHQNPGLPNWLSTTGHVMGTMCFRWIRAESHPEPVVRVIPISQLAGLKKSNDA
jgi:hypothetical protein